MFAAVAAGCGPGFFQAYTPSGAMASDMPIVPWGQTIDEPIHRVGAVASDLGCETAAERIESLRRNAWRKFNADAIVEVTQSRVNLPTKSIVRLSGTAVRFTRARAVR